MTTSVQHILQKYTAPHATRQPYQLVADTIQLLYKQPHLHTSNAVEPDVWTLYEKTLLAALDSQQLAVAELCLKRLLNQFGYQSSRIQRLQGCINESIYRYEQADLFYDTILTTDATNVLTWRRKVATLKSQNDLGKL